MASLRWKEWRLIARDPWVISQILLQILYMTPMVVLLWSGGGSTVIALGPMIVVVAFQVSSSLTWLSLSGEDAPELLATAPVSAATLRRGKLEAVGALTLAVVALPLVWLAAVSLAGAAVTLALIGFAIGSAVLLQSWHGKPAKRSAFAARHRQSKLLSLIEMGLSMLWGISTALVMLGSLWALVPLAALSGTVLCSRPRRAPSGRLRQPSGFRWPAPGPPRLRQTAEREPTVQPPSEALARVRVFAHFAVEAIRSGAPQPCLQHAVVAGKTRR